MAFTSSVVGNFAVSRSKRLSFGTFTNAATDSGGDIDTGLKACDAVFLTCSSHYNTAGARLSSISAGTATVVTDDGADGYWLALGT